MKKTIYVKTSKGEKTYRIETSGSKYVAYTKSGWGGDRIGEARSLEDAITLIRVDAKQYGEVKGVRM